MRAVARPTVETGVPITVHTHPTPKAGLRQTQVMVEEEGVDPGRIVLGHTATPPTATTSPRRRGRFHPRLRPVRYRIRHHLRGARRHAHRMVRRGYAEQIVLFPGRLLLYRLDSARGDGASAAVALHPPLGGTCSPTPLERASRSGHGHHACRRAAADSLQRVVGRRCRAANHRPVPVRPALHLCSTLTDRVSHGKSNHRGSTRPS